MDEQKCENCRYFVPQRIEEINMAGHPNHGQLWVRQSQQCRRFPTYVSKASYEWCGEWQAA